MAANTITGDFNINAEVDVESIEASARKARMQGIKRLVRYTLLKLVALVFTVAVGVYITIVVANMGGAVDKIRLGTIRESVALAATADPAFKTMNSEQRVAYINSRVDLEIKRYGLDRPFLVRSFEYLWDGMTLNFGFSQQLVSDSGSRLVRNILLERLPSTLLLFGSANLILFFVALFAGLSLSRRYGSMADKVVLALAPTSAAPAWFYGLFLILIFAAMLKVLPFGGMVSAPPPDNPVDYLLSLLNHMILPMAAWLISAIFLTAYNWRTFFLIYSSEDYVEMAKAKGLSDRMIERRYILRPTLPNIITSFALLLITLWTGAIIFETVFNWPGIGQLYYRAIGAFDTPVIVANVVLYAYLLALTVFVLDFVYALVDPRVRVGDGGRK
ncbi:MAG: ABC transporter permease [Anaerolineae bacterium]|nr:ABC transporter permease [Anaerolineae bacterium]